MAAGAASSLLLVAVLASPLPFASAQQQFLGTGGFLGMLGGLASYVMPSGLLSFLQPTGSPSATVPPQYGQGGYYGDTSFSAPRPSSVREALERLVARDSRRCVARLACEAAAGALEAEWLPFDITGRQLAGGDGLVSLLSMAVGNPSATGAGAPQALAAAFLLGAAARGRPHTCRSAYPLCPQDPQRLLLYLNNHRGGVFRLFSGPPSPFEGYYRDPYGRSLGDVPSVELPAEHRSRRAAFRLTDEKALDNAVDASAADGGSEHSRIMHPDFSRNVVRFPEDLQAVSTGDSEPDARIVSGHGAYRLAPEPSQSTGAWQWASGAFPPAPGAPQPGGAAFPPAWQGGSDEYVLTAGGGEFPLAPGQTPEAWQAASLVGSASTPPPPPPPPAPAAAWTFQESKGELFKGTRKGRRGERGERGFVFPREQREGERGPLPMVFPDRTGTGDLRLDFQRPARGAHTKKMAFPQD